MSTFDCGSSAARLNELIGLLQSQVATGAEHSVYEARIHETAASIHAEILEAVQNRCEVRAQKGNGRVLTIHAVSPIRRSRFRYGGGFDTPEHFLHDECELVAVARFEVSTWP